MVSGRCLTPLVVLGVDDLPAGVDVT